jgi:MoaA/NifB/PqqE/SkfB family radical SAM enzyme
MSNLPFTHLVLKPELACTAKCKTCSSRKELHKVKKKEMLMSMEDWKMLFQEVNQLGLTRLTFSGGEPTLYKHLLDLIEEGKKYDWEIGLNTNGSLVNEYFANQLIDAGLDAVCVSLYSHDPSIHDQIRGHDGLWRKAVQAIELFSRIREKEKPELRVDIQTILCQDNFRDFSNLVRLAYEKRACGLLFSYLEGDFTERKYLLDEEQIGEFKTRILKETDAVIHEMAPDRWTSRTARSAIRSLYPLRKISAVDYAHGIYRMPTPCHVPTFFSIILANGDVHPCNMVEYTHSPVIANLHDRSFTEIWEGEEWKDFRKNGFEKCRYCPVPCQVYIPVNRRSKLAPLQYLIRYSLLKPFYPRVKRAVLQKKKMLNRWGI